MDHPQRFGYASLTFALAQGLATLGTAVAGGSPLAVGLDFGSALALPSSALRT